MYQSTKLYHVQPMVDCAVELDRVGGDVEAGREGVLVVQHLAQVAQGLAQAVQGVGIVDVGPEQAGQRVATEPR